MLNIQLLLTGNELMSGDVVDTNSVTIAQELALLGLEVKRKVTVSDDFDDLIDEIEHTTKKADILIINGGLGPTIDDLTAQALSRVTQKPIEENSDALAHLKSWCKKRNYQLNEPNLKQAMLPQGCQVIKNAIGSAVGFQMRHNNCDIFCTPGVPKELNLMLTEQILPKIETAYPKLNHYHVSRFHVFGIGESTLQKLINERFPDWPDDIELGFRASMPLLELKLTSKTTTAKQNKTTWIEKIKIVLGDHLIGEIIDTPKPFAQYVQELLSQHNKKVTFAESCTGGMLASAMTRIAGSSKVFNGSFITYSNQLKQELVNVQASTLENHGAVSEQTVREMARGALARTHSDIAIAVSGVAGPDGGTKEKPVGTVWIAWGNENTINTCCLLLPAQRNQFQHYVTAIGLDLVRRMLINSKEEPLYLRERKKE